MSLDIYSIFCSQSVRYKKERAQKYASYPDSLKEHIEIILLEKWRDYSFQKENNKCLFHGFSYLHKHTPLSFPEGSIFSDIIEKPKEKNFSFLQDHFVVFEEERFPFEERVFDSIVSTQTLHFINDVPGALVQARRCLKEKGTYSASFLGAETAQEIKALLYNIEEHVTGKVEVRLHPLIKNKEVSSLFQRVGFHNIIVEVELKEVRYSSLENLLHHLRQQGLTNSLIARYKALTSPHLAYKISKELLKGLSFPLSIPYEIIYVTASVKKVIND